MKNYSIGLDIGTTSVGYSVINSSTFKLMRKGGRNLWGVRLFEPGSTAVDRRLARGTRRRYDRRRQRIKYLQKEFKVEMDKVDSKFFDKLNTSFINGKEDKINYKENFTNEDKGMLKEFDTIYHLRSHLMNTTKQVDLRLIYRAIHHIIKYRGNFLYPENFAVKDIDLENDLKLTLSVISEVLEIENFDIVNINYKEIESELFKQSISEKKSNLKVIFQKYFDKDISTQLSTCLAGS